MSSNDAECTSIRKKFCESALIQSILGDLIKIKTVCTTPNEALIEYVETFLRKSGVKCRRINGDHPGRQSLLATVGPDGPDGIVLSAHSDVVPVTDQKWTTDPFILTKNENGQLFGRGTSDMKGFLACMLVAAQYAAERKTSLRRPLHLMISYDEEIGCVGIHSLLRQLAKENFMAQGCVIGEPTMLRAISGHKGKVAVRVNITGKDAHSSNPAMGCNAISIAGDFIKAIDDLQEELSGEKAMRDENFAVAHSTIQVGTIKGGIALNVVPASCTLDFEMRVLPGVDHKDYVSYLRERAEEIVSSKYGSRGSIVLKELTSYPSLNTPEEDEFLQSILHLSSANESFLKPGRISFGTEGGLVRDYLNMPVVVCGPGSIDRAHKADEYINEDELTAGVNFVLSIVDNLCK